MIRTKRKINKQRGSRSNGGGCTKKRRGAGNKGGKGKAGMGKQKVEKVKQVWVNNTGPGP